MHALVFELSSTHVHSTLSGEWVHHKECSTSTTRPSRQHLSSRAIDAALMSWCQRCRNDATYETLSYGASFFTLLNQEHTGWLECESSDILVIPSNTPSPHTVLWYWTQMEHSLCFFLLKVKRGRLLHLSLTTSGFSPTTYKLNNVVST